MKNLDEFVIVLDRKTYSSGAVINGELIATFSKPVEVLCIIVTVTGEARGRWLELWKKKKNVIPGVEQDDKKTNHSLTHETLFTSSLVLFGDEDKSEAFPHNNGRYAYKFQFYLPRELPETFRCPSEKDIGSSKYYVTATLSRENRADVSVQKPFVVNTVMDHNVSGMLLPPGLDETKVLHHCFGKGHIKLECSLKKPCFEQGELLEMSHYIENCSKTTLVVPFAKLMRKTTHDNKSFTNCIHEIQDEPLHPNNWNKWEDESFQVPMIGPTINSNDELSVDYFIRMGVKRKYGTDIFVDLPVIIGTVDDNDDASISNSSEGFVDTQVYETEINRKQIFEDDADYRFKELLLERTE